jgi:hypothetical protein
MYKNIKYWIGYYVDGFVSPHEIEAHFDLNEGVRQGIIDWNNNCDDGNEITSQDEIIKIKEVAGEFFNQTKWISSSIVQAMICQSF